MTGHVVGNRASCASSTDRTASLANRKISRVLPANYRKVPFSGATRPLNEAATARYFGQLSGESPETGTRWRSEGIQTLGAARACLGGIQPEFGALFSPNKSIRAGENLFAWGSALVRISPVPFVRQADASAQPSLRPYNANNTSAIRLAVACPSAQFVASSLQHNRECSLLLWGCSLGASLGSVDQPGPRLILTGVIASECCLVRPMGPPPCISRYGCFAASNLNPMTLPSNYQCPGRCPPRYSRPLGTHRSLHCRW